MTKRKNKRFQLILEAELYDRIKAVAEKHYPKASGRGNIQMTIRAMLRTGLESARYCL